MAISTTGKSHTCNSKGRNLANVRFVAWGAILLNNSIKLHQFSWSCWFIWLLTVMVVQGGKTSENHDYIIIIRLTLATLAKSRALVHHGLVAGVVVAVGGDQKGSLLRSLGEEDNCVVVVHSQSLLTVFLAHVLYLQQYICIFPRIYFTYICTRRNR